MNKSTNRRRVTSKIRDELDVEDEWVPQMNGKQIIKQVPMENNNNNNMGIKKEVASKDRDKFGYKKKTSTN